MRTSSSRLILPRQTNPSVISMQRSGVDRAMYVHHSLQGRRTARDEAGVVGGCLRGGEQKTFHAKEGRLVGLLVELARIRQFIRLNRGITIHRHERSVVGPEGATPEGRHVGLRDHLGSLN